MASVYPKRVKSSVTGKESVIWYVGWYQEGKHRSKSAGPSKTTAQKLRKQIDGELQSGRFDFLNRPESVMIEQSVGTFLSHTKSLKKEATFTRYRNALDHLVEFLRSKFPSVQTVQKLTKAHFAAYQDWRKGTSITANGRENGRRKNPTFKTINVELIVYRAWLNWAMTMGQIRENPLSGLKSLKTTDSKPRRVLSRREYGALLTASERIEQRTPTRKGQTDLWRFLANTGMRIGEVAHLEWTDIDFRRRVIKIQRKPDWNPKTYEREVPFTSDAADVLRKLRSTRSGKEGLVFTLASGRPLRDSVVRRWLLECADEAKVKGMRGPHDFRHTFITHALTEIRIDIPTVQRIVGHRNLETTQAYLHPTTEHIQQAVRRFEI